MKKFSFLILFTGIVCSAFSQIYLADSTVQAVAYWCRGDQQTYKVTNDKYKVQKGDTTEREKISYDVSITILDSTENSYTIQWEYLNFEIESSNELFKKLMSKSQLKKIIFKTDELGVFQELLNWKDVRDEIRRMIKPMKEEFKNIPNFDKFTDQLLAVYTDKQTIETSAINEVQLFHTFHGGKYSIPETIETTTSFPNIYGSEPLEAATSIWVYEVDTANVSFTLCSEQTVDSLQLQKAVVSYLTKLGTTLGAELPADKLPSLKNVIWTTAEIHESGWPLYAILTKEVQAEDVVKVDELLIELQ